MLIKFLVDPILPKDLYWLSRNSKSPIQNNFKE